uniref:Secreted protein n=1 Tax=Romanomermis culicivorax TaxID=13658 RepID=A0A915KPF9_ROMCU
MKIEKLVSGKSSTCATRLYLVLLIVVYRSYCLRSTGYLAPEPSQGPNWSLPSSRLRTCSFTYLSTIRKRKITTKSKQWCQTCLKAGSHGDILCNIYPTYMLRHIRDISMLIKIVRCKRARHKPDI